MKTYHTKELSQLIGVHPNTVRLYEKLQLIPPAAREANGYRVFTERHLAQFRLARLAFQVEVLQNGLRKKMVEMVKASAAGNFALAIPLANAYLRQVRQEQENASEAIVLAGQLMAGSPPAPALTLTRKEASACLHISMDALRNWEMNGLLDVKRKQNGYRVYTGEDIRRLKMIRCLRCANYSLEAILRLLSAVSENPHADLEKALNTPRADADILSACDQLLVSLQVAEQNAVILLDMLHHMQRKFG